MKMLVAIPAMAVPDPEQCLREIGALLPDFELLLLGRPGDPARTGSGRWHYLTLDSQNAAEQHRQLVRHAIVQRYDTLLTLGPEREAGRAIGAMISAARDSAVVVAPRHASRSSGSGRKRMFRGLRHRLTSYLGLDVDPFSTVRLYRLQGVIPEILMRAASGQRDFRAASLMALSRNRMPLTAAQCASSEPEHRAAESRTLMALSFAAYIAPAQFIHIQPYIADEDFGSKTRREWDTYWSAGSHEGKWLYDLIAAFYRRFIIRPAVNHFLSAYIPREANVLHAGCGSGSVDIDMAQRMKITALDISPRGLDEYARCHGNQTTLMLGSIAEIPAADAVFDGIFNLGVMEHFHREELPVVLREFNRVLKPGGHAILFWPPTWGLSVNILRLVHWFLRRVMKSNVQLHPEEYTHIRSRREAEEWLRVAGFKLKRFYFGPRDFFTHQILVAEKTADLRRVT